MRSFLVRIRRLGEVIEDCPCYLQYMTQTRDKCSISENQGKAKPDRKDYQALTKLSLKLHQDLY